VINPNHTEATIAALATPPGSGGIGIVRLSGRLALPILKHLFKPCKLENQTSSDQGFISHRMNYGWIVDPEKGVPVDEVLAVYMHAPCTYTKEDVVEIHCHGSYLVLQKILELIYAAGARPAEAGEFTKRAFLNGRIDLTRAEAVLELIEAKTPAGLEMATAQLQGRLYEKVSLIRDSLIAIRAVIEVAIDFPEEDVDILNQAELQEQLEDKVRGPLAALIASAEQGKIFREGISAVILGKPNVGKSSLLNCLLKEERALVTPVPGTTRDTIEEYININGIPVRIVDTAGIRDTNEIVEEMGILRARAKLAEADLILFMLDNSEPLTKEDYQLHASIRKENQKGKLLIVLNKTDLPSGLDRVEDITPFGGEAVVALSAKTSAGVEELSATIFKIMTEGEHNRDLARTGSPNLRHKSAMIKAMDACDRVLDGLCQNLPSDLLAIDLQAALDHLGDIVGETTTEDVLDMIFERFCIGK